ncbi:MAG TPA: RNA polymerase subunit sigma-70, partial [Aequorivita sp.]|nr:RNA polymerase subunit sigma-70 [Aequorivita sp.]
LVFNLYQMDGFSHKEIASLLNISEGTSKSNYHRAKLILRDKIIALSIAINPKTY